MRLEIKRDMAAVVGFAAFLLVFSFAPVAHAQSAADEKTLLGKIDDQESGLIAEEAGAESSLSDSAAQALGSEAERDAGYFRHAAKKPTFFAPAPATTPTLDPELQAIESDIEKLESQAHDPDHK